MSLNLDNSTLNTENEYKILLFGENDAGKSTFVNALKCLQYSSCEEAKNFINLQNAKHASDVRKVGCMPPLNPFNLKFGDKFGKQQSTRRPIVIDIVHKVCVENNNKNNSKTILLIDTPSIGRSKDSEKLKQTQQYLAEHKSRLVQLHRICVFLRWNEASNTTGQNVIAKILFNLPENALGNVVFYFTFVKDEIYIPSKRYLALKSYLRESGITLRPGVNCFYFDNEGHLNSNESWNKSRSQIKMFLNQVSVLKPVNIESLFEHKNQNKNFPNLDSKNDTEFEYITTEHDKLEFFKKLIEEKLLNVENKNNDKNTNDFTNAKLENVIFIGDNSKGNFGNVAMSLCQGRHIDEDFIIENIDHIIKSNIQEVFSIMREQNNTSNDNDGEFDKLRQALTNIERNINSTKSDDDNENAIFIELVPVNCTLEDANPAINQQPLPIHPCIFSNGDENDETQPLLSSQDESSKKHDDKCWQKLCICLKCCFSCK